LDPKRRWSDQPEPMMSGSNIHFEMAERDRAINLRTPGGFMIWAKEVWTASPES
jgi:hypothetical protein